MAPKKKEVQKLSLVNFMNDASYGGSSWADEVEDTIGYSSIRDNVPQTLPNKPPYMAYLGNLSYDATAKSVSDFFSGYKILNVQMVEDREQNQPKGFAFAEFEKLEGLKEALTRDGVSFKGRSIRIKIAGPLKDKYGSGSAKDKYSSGGGESTRDFSDWSRKGPLTDLPSRGGDRGGNRRGPSDFGKQRAPGQFSGADNGKVRDSGNWERRGPLSPLLPQAKRRPESRDGSRLRTNDGARSESVRGPRGASPTKWGLGKGHPATTSTSRPPRRKFANRPNRPERVPTAAEKDSQWRSNMRPDLTGESPVQSCEGSEAPPYPAGHPATLPMLRPKLNLTKRTISEMPAVPSPVAPATEAKDSKASPFGAARPVDTATRDREIEEKRIQAIKDKNHADKKAKKDKRIAKENAIKEPAAREAAAAEAAAKEAAASLEPKRRELREARETARIAKSRAMKSRNWRSGSGDQQAPTRSAHAPNAPRHEEAAASLEPKRQESREVRKTAAIAKSRAMESENWRSASRDQRAPARGAHAPSAPRCGGGPPRGPRSDA
ncbi:hypothetical protein B0T26DRAFT_806927 [Lasiosphaeria miniovina]|uniref:RRM domain-containing protein n=1 Tax=Lasiosphaeria miniovina TaxID=1954250 RepID=A0AA39ZTL2_9PEZI|nr:uncharacterized protein B0T26DRAFT_806927 [Lasiosphaeria miniovina]KAK0703320.1 hypothetical protein B0T26DRAFT_806927 [Lasiosphaeria miniovina]